MKNFNLYLAVFTLFNIFSSPLGGQNNARILEHPQQIRISRLDQLNSSFRETNLSITPDGRYLFFQTQRGGMPWSVSFGSFRGQERYDGDIWFSRKGEDGQWQAPRSLDREVNTANGEDEPNVSADGQSIVFQSWKDGWESTGGPYYQAELRGEKWQKAVGLGGGINRYFVGEFRKYSAYATDGVTLSADGRLFLVACGPEYDEALDLYLSRKVNDQWSPLRKMDLSTEKDERSLFLAGDNRTLFFASDGFGGFGGLDIFKTTIDSMGHFGEIINIGKPFNTAADDYGFIITAAGREAYFVRDGDIYFADLTEAHPDIRPLPTLIVSGFVRDPSGKPTESEVIVVQRDHLQPLASGRSNAISGEYSLAIPKQTGRYEIVFLKPGEPELRIPLDIDNPDTYEERRIDGRLPAPPSQLPAPAPDPALTPEEQPYYPPLVQFDFDQTAIKAVFVPELEALSRYLKAHPQTSVLLVGHTDSKGKDTYNIDLGRRRAESIRRYLQSLGVENPINIQTQGEKSPVDDNTIPAGAYRNRRTEIRLIE